MLPSHIGTFVRGHWLQRRPKEDKCDIWAMPMDATCNSRSECCTAHWHNHIFKQYWVSNSCSQVELWIDMASIQWLDHIAVMQWLKYTNHICHFEMPNKPAKLNNKGNDASLTCLAHLLVVVLLKTALPLFHYFTSSVSVKLDDHDCLLIFVILITSITLSQQDYERFSKTLVWVKVIKIFDYLFCSD